MKRLNKTLLGLCLCLLLISGCAGRIAEPTQTKIVEPDAGKKSLSLYHFYRKETFGLSGWQVTGKILAAGAIGAVAGTTSAVWGDAGVQHNQLLASTITSTWIAGDIAQQQKFQRIVEQAVDKVEMNPSSFRLKYTQKGMIWSKASREISPIITVQNEQIDTYGECFVNTATWYCAAEVGCGHLFGPQRRKARRWIKDTQEFGKCVSDALYAHIGQMQKCRLLTAPQQQDYLTAFIKRAEKMKEIVDESGENYVLEYYNYDSQKDNDEVSE
ncbi:hypothetical protein [Candidatus Mycalebacterium sp.]